MKITFKCEYKGIHKGDNQVIKITTDAICHGDIALVFNDFLRGAGFIYEGKYELVQPEVESEDIVDEEDLEESDIVETETSAEEEHESEEE